MRSKSINAFRFASNSVVRLSVAEQRLRWHDFENNRLHLLELVVAQEEECIRELEQQQKTAQREKELLQEEYSSLLAQQEHKASMIKQRDEMARKLLARENTEIRLRLKREKDRTNEKQKRKCQLERAQEERQHAMKLDARARVMTHRKRLEEVSRSFQEGQEDIVAYLHNKDQRQQEFLKNKAAVRAKEKKKKNLKSKANSVAKRLLAQRAARQRETLERVMAAKAANVAGFKEHKRQQQQHYFAIKKVKKASFRRTIERQQRAQENRQAYLQARRSKAETDRRKRMELKNSMKKREKQMRCKAKVCVSCLFVNCYYYHYYLTTTT